jgi:hypothetical protein
VHRWVAAPQKKMCLHRLWFMVPLIDHSLLSGAHPAFFCGLGGGGDDPKVTYDLCFTLRTVLYKRIS